MLRRDNLLISIVLLLLSGCHTPPLQSIDESVAALAKHPFDLKPTSSTEPGDAQRPSDVAKPPEGAAGPFAPATSPDPKPADTPPSATGVTPSSRTGSQGPPVTQSRTGEVVLASYVQSDRDSPVQGASPLNRFELMIPSEIPGAETPVIKLPSDRARQPDAVAGLFPRLPPLPEEPVPLPGPDGRPYSLAELQRLAAANSPALRQAAADVENARGQMIQAGLYPNPTVGYTTAPNANNTASTTQGFYVDQVIKTGGKLKVQTAVGKMNLVVAELALRRARYDLATTIRRDYYNLLVAEETVRVNKGLAHFTDEIYRLQADLLGGGFAASHEPAALRSQAFTVRLAYKQSIANYIYAWKSLVADMGLQQLPLSAVEGKVDRNIPFYEYDAVRAYVLKNHTDVLTARANMQGSKYGLKLAQITPVPDVEVYAGVWKEQQIEPFQNYYQITLSIPLALWDRNQGGIRAASAGLIRASEAPHSTEVSLTAGLSAAYGNYKSNLAAVEYYRSNILPDQVRYYRGVFERRKIDPGASFGDLVQAQQVLVSDVNAYLGVLGSLWTSVVNVADYLQTDDLFQVGGTLELPHLPDFDGMLPLPCSQPHVPSSSVRAQTISTPVPAPSVAPIPAPLPAPTSTPAGATTAPVSRMTYTLGRMPGGPSPMGAANLFASSTDPVQPDSKPERRLLDLASPFAISSLAAVLTTTQQSEFFTPALSRRSGAASY